MLVKSIKMQLKLILGRKSAIIIFYGLIALVLYTYFSNIIAFSGRDIGDMYHPMKILTLSQGQSTFGRFMSAYFLQYYPLIVIIPVGFSYFTDRNTRAYVFIRSRVGNRSYYIGKLISVFIANFLIFTIPFFIEIMLNTIAFPIEANGDPLGNHIYTEIFIEMARNFLFSDIYIQNPYVYALLITLLFGIVSGTLGLFTVSISTFNIKYKLLLFLPVYALLNIVAMLKDTISSINVSTHYFNYLRIFDVEIKSDLGYLILLFGILIVSILIFILKIKREDIA